LPLPLGDLNNVIHGSLGPSDSALKQHLDRFSRFCGVHKYDQHTDRPTTLLRL